MDSTINNTISNNKTLEGLRAVWVTGWGWPFGGGESFFYQCARWSVELGMEVFWISFYQNSNECHEHLEYIKTHFGAYLIKIPRGFTEDKLVCWLRFLKPSFVHHQGSLRLNILRVCKTLDIPFITGFHFWSGGIDLDRKANNRDIIKNIRNHKKNTELDQVVAESDIVYVASEFMQTVFKQVTNYHIQWVLNPISGAAECKVNDMDPWLNTYVTILNIHRNKGGDIILHLVKNMPGILFHAVKTEPYNEKLYKQIHLTLKFLQNGIFSEVVEDVRLIYVNTKILLIPSLVDETFCRVAYEALLNRIPVITTGKGNILNVTGDAAIYVNENDLHGWEKAVYELSTNENLYRNLQKKANKRLEYLQEENVKQIFNDMILSALHNRYEKKCVMILTPWCDQGLGYQSRHYVGVLERKGIKTCIFAVKPYWETNSNERNERNEKHQANPEEWIHPRIYYSPNQREEIRDDELKEFVFNYKITDCIIPETCWFRIFQIASYLESIHVRCIGIPNIETVRKSEILKHQSFSKILCNNNLCMTHFMNFRFTNIEKIGYAMEERFQDTHVPAMHDPVQFLFLGGMNAFTRKQVVKVLEAFSCASESLTKQTGYRIKITICIQFIKPEQLELIEKFNEHPDIEIVLHHQTGKEIEQRYKDCHVSVQVSHHEGLGLGFFESISLGIPVITLNAAPHNEIIKHRVNGIIIPCHFLPMLDNEEALFGSAHFQIDDLANVFYQLGTDRNLLKHLLISTKKDYKERFDLHRFGNALVSAIIRK